MKIEWGTASRGESLQNTTYSRGQDLPPPLVTSTALCYPFPVPSGRSVATRTNTEAVSIELAKTDVVKCNLTFQEGTELNWTLKSHFQFLLLLLACYQTAGILPGHDLCMKLLRDFWGNYFVFLGGVVVDTRYHAKTSWCHPWLLPDVDALP